MNRGLDWITDPAVDPVVDLTPDSEFGSQLIEALQPVRGFCLAAVAYQAMELGIMDQLKGPNPVGLEAVCATGGFERRRLWALLTYLKNERVVLKTKEGYLLSEKGLALLESRPWYQLLIGGYAQTLLSVGGYLVQDSGYAERDSRSVGIGSCGISHFDAIPLTRTLMSQLESQPQTVLDLGCGSGLSLIELCREIPEIRGIGVDPDAGAVEEGRQAVREAGLDDRIELFVTDARTFLNDSRNAREPDCLVMAFFLQELIEQDGIEAVQDTLRSVLKRYEGIAIIVIEVDNQFDQAITAHHGLGRAYYNPYYLLHYFTEQRLETTAFWRRFFEACELDVICEATADHSVDSTDLEIGFLLRKRSSP